VLELCQEKGGTAGNNRKLRRDIKVIRLRKAMKTKALLGDQTFDHHLIQLREMG
jgi:Tfp pilus assembly ATPase PilU